MAEKRSKSLFTKYSSSLTNRKKIILLIICSIAFIFSIITIVKAHQNPIKVEKTYTICNYLQEGRYDYKAILNPNLIYNKSILNPGEGTIYLKITDYIDTNFTYKFNIHNLQDAANITVNYEIKANLITSQWEKKFFIVPNKTINIQGNNITFINNYLVNISNINTIMETIKEETGTYDSTYNMTIIPEIHTIANTEYGIIETGLTPLLTMKFIIADIKGRYVLLDGLYEKLSGYITDNEIILRPWVINQMFISYVFIIVSFSSLSYNVWIYIKNRPHNIINPIDELINPFKEITIKISKTPLLNSTKIQLKSLEEIIDLADGLGKPVLFNENYEEQNTYFLYVYDGSIRYEYKITQDVINEISKLKYNNENKKNEYNIKNGLGRLKNVD